jgi:hypothetical protein
MTCELFTLENTHIDTTAIFHHLAAQLASKLPCLLAYLERDTHRTRRAVPNTLETIVRRCITLDHPHRTREQIAAELRETLAARGQYTFLAADLLVAESA